MNETNEINDCPVFILQLVQGAAIMLFREQQQTSQTMCPLFSRPLQIPELKCSSIYTVCRVDLSLIDVS